MSATGAAAGPASMRPVVLLSMAGFCSMAAMRVADPLLPEVAAEFATTPGNASVIGTAFALAYGICQVAYGPLGDRFGKYRIVALAIAAATITVAATALARSLLALAALRFTAGAATAAAIPLSLAYIGDITTYDQRQPVLARYMTGTILGLLFGQVAGGVIMEVAGWRAVFLVLAGGYLLVTTLLFVELRSRRVVHRLSPNPVRPARILAQYLAIMKERHPRRVLIAVFLEGFLLYGGLAYLGAFLRTVFAIDYGRIGLMLAGFGGGGLLYIVISRPVIRRLGERGMVRIGGACVLIGFILMTILPSWHYAAPSNLLLGFGFFLIHNTLQANATQMAPDARGSAVSLFAFFLFMGQASGIALLGLVVDRAGYVPVFLFCGGAMVALSLWFARAVKPAAR
jgi:predicted MFS family arabinose efflux permease